MDKLTPKKFVEILSTNPYTGIFIETDPFELAIRQDYDDGPVIPCYCSNIHKPVTNSDDAVVMKRHVVYSESIHLPKLRKAYEEARGQRINLRLNDHMTEREVASYRTAWAVLRNELATFTEEQFIERLKLLKPKTKWTK